jgi:hypothetical protein
MDALHSTLSGPAKLKLCERLFQVFGDARFEQRQHLQWPSLQPEPAQDLSEQSNGR